MPTPLDDLTLQVLASAWQSAATSIRALPPSLTPEHRKHLLDELGSDAGVDLARKHGVCSLTRTEAISLGYGVWQGKDKPSTGCSGLLFPFGHQFGQIRLDQPETLVDVKGKKVGKYRNRSYVKAEAAIIGNPYKPVTLGTEGWKDAARLHLATGETVAALAGVTQWKLLPETVTRLLYDPDTIVNPGVWGPLLNAGLARPRLQIGFFPEEIAGEHGGACEFFRNGGNFEDIRFYSPKELIRTLPQFWKKDRQQKGQSIPGNIRPDWRARSVKKLGLLAYQAGMGRDGAEQIIRTAAKAAGVNSQDATRIMRELRRTVSKETYIRGEKLTTKELQDFLLEHHQLEFDTLAKYFIIDGTPIRPEESAHFNQWLADKYGIDVSPRIASGALEYLTMKNRHNPVECYLRKLRVRTDLTPVDTRDIAGAFGFDPDDNLSRDMLIRHLIGALTRGLMPSYKHDQMLILSGDQGWKKTVSINSLVALPDWSDAATEIKDYAAWPFLLRISGCWHFTLDECEHTLRSRSAAENKSMITQQHDRFALKFQNVVQSWPRPCVIWGTTNASVFLSDHTGARRFWVCPLVHECNPKWIADNRDRIWLTIWLLAEAGMRNFYEVGSPRDEAATARASEVSTDDSWLGPISKYLSGLPTTGNGVSADQILKALPQEICDPSNKGRGRLSRLIEAKGFTTHCGTIRWVRKRYRYDAAPNALVGYAPQPVELKADNVPPTEVDYTWSGEPITVQPWARNIPQGWPSLEPWYDLLSAYQSHPDKQKISLTPEGWQVFCESVLPELNTPTTEATPPSAEPPQAEASEIQDAAPHQPPEVENHHPLRHRDDPKFTSRTTWKDPSNPTGPSGRPRFLRVVSTDWDGLIELQPKEMNDDGSAYGYGQRLLLTPDLHQRLQQWEVG